MHAVVETDEYLREAKRCRITDDERNVIVDFIADHPTAGTEIAGTGGVRKVRFPKPGMGKSGGYRLITFYLGYQIALGVCEDRENHPDTGGKNSFRVTMGHIVSAYHARKETRS